MAIEDNTTDKEPVPRRVKVKKEAKEEAQFSKSRNDELKELTSYGTLQAVNEASLAGTPHIFESRFVDHIKRVGSALKRT